jgi:hypothetical protein
MERWVGKNNSFTKSTKEVFNIPWHSPNMLPTIVLCQDFNIPQRDEKFVQPFELAVEICKIYM